MQKSAYVLICFFLGLVGCSSKKPFAESNKVYLEQTKILTEPLTLPLEKPKPMDPLDSLFKEAHQQDIDWIGTVNFNLRKPNFIVLHHTAQDSIQQTLHTFTLERSQVSAHYIIDKHGRVFHLLNDYLRSWHAGVGKWGTVSDLNSISLGIELDNNGIEPYPAEQINNLLVLLDTLKLRYHIPAENFIGHGDIAPGRKIDPGINFPWKSLAEKGFGLWYDSVATQIPTTFNPLDGLRILGYDTKNPSAAVLAFKRHFTPEEPVEAWTPHSLGILYSLYLKRINL